MKAKPRKAAPARIVPAGTLKNLSSAARKSAGAPISHAIDSQTMLRDITPGYGNALRLPELPPGVIPAKPPTGKGLVLAMDNGCKEMAFDDMPSVDGLFGWGNTNFAFGYFFQGYPYLAQLLQVAEYRAPSEMQAAEMTRRWLKLKVSKKPKKKDGTKELAQDEGKSGETETEDNSDPLDDKIVEITQAMEDFKLRDHFRTCIQYDGFFGRGQLYIRIKGQEDDLKRQAPLEIDPKNIPKGSLLGFQPIEPYWTTPYSYNATDPTRPDFYKPSSWFVMGKKTHHTRLLMFLSRPVPDLLKPAYNFGGLSWTQLLEPAVNMWLRTRKSVNDFIHKFSITALMTNLAALLEDTENGGVLGRAQLFANNKDNQGLMLLDKATEEIVKADTSLSGLDKLQAQAQEHMAAIVHQPLVIMTGVTPSGLNASSEGEIQVWHEFLSSQQQLVDNNAKLCIEAIQCHLYGMIDDSITHEWVPLDEPTAKELAEERKSDADRDGVLIDKGVLDPQEVRDKLAKDPNSGYDGLTGEAPGLPEPTLDGEGTDDDDEEDGSPDLEHASSEADKDRKHQSKENEKDRKNALKLAKAKKTA
jgi:hypothetical protein